MTDEIYNVDTYLEIVFAFSQFLISSPQLKEKGSDTNRDISEELLYWLAWQRVKNRVQKFTSIISS